MTENNTPTPPRRPAPTPATHPRLAYRLDGLRWRGKLKMPRHAHPLVKALYRAAKDQQVTMAEITREAGLGRGVIGLWGSTYNPRIDDLDAALNVLGLRLAVVPLETQETEARR